MYRIVLFVLAVSAASASAADIGDRAPAFEGTTLRGHPVSTAALRGRVVVVDFWATWCAPCRQELPELQRLHGRYRDRGLVVLGVNVDRERAAAETFLEARRIRFPNLHDPERAIAERFGLPTMPTAYVIDARGIVRHVNAGYRAGDGRRIARIVEGLLPAEGGEAEAPAAVEETASSEPPPATGGEPVGDDAPSGTQVEPADSGRRGGLCAAEPPGRGNALPWALPGLIFAVRARARRRS